MKEFIKDKLIPILIVILLGGSFWLLTYIYEEKFIVWVWIPFGFFILFLAPLLLFIFDERPTISTTTDDGIKFKKVKLFSKTHIDYLKKETWKNTRPIFTFIGICTVIYWILIILDDLFF